MKTYVYKTTRLRPTWQSLASGDLKGYAHVVKQDLVNPELLFVGTETGLFVSVDGGQQWGQFTGNLPNVAVRDLAIHPRDHDLIIATHGRGIYIVDDITPLRTLTRELAEKDVAFLGSRPTPMYIPAVEFVLRRRLAVRGSEPARGRDDHLLPEEAAPDRRPQARGLRLGRKARLDAPRRQAARAQPRRLADAGTGAEDAGRLRLRRHLVAVRSARARRAPTRSS